MAPAVWGRESWQFEVGPICVQGRSGRGRGEEEDGSEEKEMEGRGGRRVKGKEGKERKGDRGIKVQLAFVVSK